MVELELNPFVLLPIVAALAGMVVGFVSIWNNVRNARADQRRALNERSSELKADVKNIVDLRLAAMEAKVDAVRTEMIQMHQQEVKDSELTKFFATWIQRVEDRIDRKITRESESAKDAICGPDPKGEAET